MVHNFNIVAVEVQLYTFKVFFEEVRVGGVRHRTIRP